MEIRTLAGIGWEELAAAFNAAFADYAVKLAMTADGLAHMQRRRGYVADASFGAFDGGRLAGFVFTCRNGDRIYNSGTGVVPAQRRARLGRALVDAVIAQVPHRSYLLEVLADNPNAIALYASVGFIERRRFQSFTYAARDAPVAEVAELATADLDAIAVHADFELGWQNSVAALRRATEPYIVLGDERGAAVVFPGSADLPLLAVAPAHRRRGHGTRLLAAAARRAGRPLRIINIDQSATGVAGFLAHAGATPLARQLEMIRVASPTPS